MVYNDLATPMPKNALDTSVHMWDTAEQLHTYNNKISLVTSLFWKISY